MSDPTEYAELIGRSINVADARLGATGLFATDEFFAPLARMLNPAEPEWRAGVYDDHGKWMDGWESRRRRDEGHDYCIVQLAAPSSLVLLDIDTRFFTGNFAPLAGVEGCRSATPPDAKTRWTSLLPTRPLKGDQHNFFPVDSASIWSHLKLNIHPDGGVARLRAYGSVHRTWGARAGTETIDLAAALNGGRALACSDEHYGSMHNVLLPGTAASMADGWETRRRREPGFDWMLLRLGHPGRIEGIDVDTAHFKGNFPHQISVNAAFVRDAADDDLRSQSLYWPTLLEAQHLAADKVLQFREQLTNLGPVSHLRVNLHPDGGLSRLRVFGKPHIEAA